MQRSRLATKPSSFLARNKKDLPDVPKETKKGLKFAFVKNTAEALRIDLNTE